MINHDFKSAQRCENILYLAWKVTYFSVLYYLHAGLKLVVILKFITAYNQEPITRSVQLPHIPITASS